MFYCPYISTGTNTRHSGEGQGTWLDASKVEGYSASFGLGGGHGGYGGGADLANYTAGAH